METASEEAARCLAYNFDQVVNLGDHTANRRGVLQDRGPANTVQTQAHQGGPLVLLPTDRTASLANSDLSHGLFSVSGSHGCAIGTPAEHIRNLLAALVGDLTG